MRKWTICTLLLTLHSFPSYADTDLIYYTGGAFGGNFMKSDVSYDYVLKNNGTLLASPSENTNNTSSSVTGQLQFGVGIRKEWFYLGGEILGQFFDGEFSTIENTLIGNNNPTNIRMDMKLRDFELAFDLKPGIYLFEETLVYARIGFGINRLEINDSAYIALPQLPQILAANSNNSNDVYPFRLGFGVEREFFEDISIFIDYVYSHYADISTQGTGFNNGYELDVMTDAENIRRQTIQLGLNYYYD